MQRQTSITQARWGKTLGTSRHARRGGLPHMHPCEPCDPALPGLLGMYNIMQTKDVPDVRPHVGEDPAMIVLACLG
jgi:hypothetical protein